MKKKSAHENTITFYFLNEIIGIITLHYILHGVKIYKNDIHVSEGCLSDLSKKKHHEHLRSSWPVVIIAKKECNRLNKFAANVNTKNI